MSERRKPFLADRVVAAGDGVLSVKHAVEYGIGAFWSTAVQLMAVMHAGQMAHLRFDDGQTGIGVAYLVFGVYGLFCGITYTPCLWMPDVFAPPVHLGAPAALRASEHVRRWSVLRRVVSVPWWLLLFVVGLVGAVAAGQIPADDLSEVGRFLFVTAMTFFYCTVANAILLAGLAACGVGWGGREWVWRKRFLIDFGVAVISATGVVVA